MTDGEIEFKVCEKCHGVMANIGESIVIHNYDVDTNSVETTYVCGNCAHLLTE